MKPYPLFCSDCKYATFGEYYNEYYCTHPKVNAKDGWLLGSVPKEGVARGKECRYERRDEGWFSACGLKGKLWEAVAK